jgi:hypothetical protein
MEFARLGYLSQEEHKALGFGCPAETQETQK